MRYALPLPPELPAGAYRLALQLAGGPESGGQAPVVVGDIAVRGGSHPEPAPSHPLAVRFGSAIELTGFDLEGVKGAATSSMPPVVNAGETLHYTLYWRALGPMTENYHGFLHLVDGQGRPLVQRDTLAGGVFAPPRLWNAYYSYPDEYRLQIPPTAESGLYWPLVGLYEYATQERLPVSDTQSGTTGDHFRLAPVKVLGRQDARPQQTAQAHFGDLADLLGYDLTLPAGGLRAGSRFGLTLYYRSLAPTVNDYTRFAHVYSAESGMAA